MGAAKANFAAPAADALPALIYEMGVYDAPTFGAEFARSRAAFTFAGAKS